MTGLLAISCTLYFFHGILQRRNLLLHCTQSIRPQTRRIFGIVICTLSNTQFALLQVVNKPKKLPIFITNTRPFKQQPPNVEAHILTAQHLLSPILSSLSYYSSSRIARSMLVGKILQNGIQVLKGIIYRYKMLPRNKSVVVPFSVNSSLER